MVRKKLAVAVAALGALQADVVSALGMGDFTLRSALNQPLDAEIRLLNTGDLDPSQVKIALAGTEEFQQAGVSRDYFLTNLQFTVDLDQNGGGVINVTSREPVIEPYLNFLVEAKWPTGRLLREYTVLLDLPVFSESATEQVDSAASSAPTVSEQPASVRTSAAAIPSSSRAAAPRQSRDAGELAAGSKYRVQTNDTLWEIAAKARPSGATVQQTMLGIQRLNSHAFMNGNINLVKAGSILRLPTQAELNDISSRQAVEEVAVQNKAWRSGESLASEDTGAQLDATATSTRSDQQAVDQARLSIASSGDSSERSDGDGAASGSGTEALRNQLDTSLENLDKTQRENEELQSRIGDMEAKLATLQRLLELKDDELAALQGTAAERNATEGSTTESSLAEGQAATSEPSAEAEMSADTTAVTGTESAATTTEPEQAAPQPRPAPAPEPELLDQILSNPLYLGGAGALVLALAALILMRRRQAAEDETSVEEMALFEEVADETAEESLEEAGELDFSSAEEVAEEADSTDQLVAELEQEIAADNAVEAAQAETEEQETVQSETGDAIAEADIYVAYGRYQQAIDLLTTAVEQEPQRTDLRVKLLEVFIETRDKPGFQQHYVALQALGDESAINEVKETLSSVEGVSDWLDDLPSADVSDFSDADMDADLIESDDQEVELDLEDDLEIDLDLDGASTTQETETIDLEDDFDLDGELDLDQEEPALDATLQLDAVSLDADAKEETENLVDDQDLNLMLDEELSLDTDSEEALTTEETAEDLDLDSLQADDDSTTESAEVEVTEEGFDLDLDSDLDMDLGELGDSELDDLAAEFGDQEPSADDEQEPSSESQLSGDGFPEAEESAKTDEPDLTMGLSTLDEVEGEFSLDVEGSEAEELGLDELSDLEDLTASAEPEAAVASESANELTDLEFTAGDLDLSAEPEAAPVENAVDDESLPAEAASEDDFDFLADTDEVATKLDLARAYIDMGDTEGAKDILDEVVQEGNETQIQEANELLERV